MLKRTLLALALALIMTATAGMALAGGKTAIERAKDANWDCFGTPLGGYDHCAPPGKPSIDDLISGTTAPSLVLSVFNPDGSFAGNETLLRADLYGGQPCPQDNLAEWGLLPFGYYACHHFDT